MRAPCGIGLGVGKERGEPASRSRAGRGAHLALTAAGLLVATASPVWAIPSPDVVIGLFASAAQVLGLLTVVLGSVAYSRRGRSRKGLASGSRWPLRVVVVLLLASLAANALQYTRRVDERTERLRRNLVRSSQENGSKVGDISLKTLAFSDQLEHPLGLSTDQLSERLSTPQSGLRIVDVREPEEAEMGRISTARHARYPDLRQEPTSLLDPAGENILLCYSGNRSSELCEEFRARGIACRFLIGGYEKWIAEGRPLELAEGRDPSELRSLPDFPGKRRLLDTPEVERLVRERGAIFVDVRYEGDFELAHLPDAINVPLRKLPTTDMNAALDALPRRPIIAPCYDKRSSFYAQILGVRLHRKGYEFLGRYTVPHEFLVAKSSRPHVQAFVDAQGTGLVGVLARPLEALLSFLDEHLGHLALAILAAVVLLRVIVLPLSIKSERDQVVSRELAPRIAQIRVRLADDPTRASRAVLALQRAARLTPGRNLLGSTAQIVLFLVFFAAVSGVARGNEDGLLWIDALGKPDSLHILPFALGVLVWAHLEIGASSRRLSRRVLRLVGAAVLVGLTYRLPAALGLYLFANVALLAVQARVIERVLRRLRDARRRVLQPSALAPRAIAPLSLAHRVPGAGNKALKLAQLRAAGFPVPDGFVVTSALLDRDHDGLRLTEAERSTLRAQWRRLGADRVAVRSSGLNEDGSDQSYAGVFESILNVDEAGLIPALEEVHRSLRSTRATAYSGLRDEAGGVLVQRMVPAEYAGVLFTLHPSETGSLLVEMVQGLGEALVSGAANPDGYRFGRVSGELLDESAPPIDLRPLVAMARRVEELYGKPQDIEWAWADGRFLLLQTRDITTSATGEDRRGLFEAERRRLIEVAARCSSSGDGGSCSKVGGPHSADETFLEQNELSELLPSPTPLSLSLLRALWAPGGSADLACRDFGMPYTASEDGPPIVETVFGRLYINRVAERRALGRGASSLASFRLARGADGIRARFEEEFLPEFLREVRLREAVDLERLTNDELLELLESWTRRFVEETYVEAERINVAADFYVKSAARELEKRGLSVTRWLGGAPETVVHQAMALLPRIRSGERPVGEFLASFGHRAPRDWELEAPRYCEDPATVRQLVERSRDVASPAHRAAIHEEESSEPSTLPRLVRLAVDRAREFQSLKESAKHHALRELSLVRRVLLELDRRFDLGGEIFLLELDEITLLRDPIGRSELSARRARRRAERAAFASLELAPRVSVADLERLSPDGKPQRVAAEGGLAGLAVSGRAPALGRARVVRSPEEIGDFEDGEVLVARFTDPTWTPLFPRAAAVLTEVGGRLSHAAIVAREYGVTAVVGVAGLLDRVETGDLLRIELDGRIETVEERRVSDRRGVAIHASLERQGQLVDALVVHLSRTGALVATETPLADGQDVVLRIDGEEAPLEAEVVRVSQEGRYGLRFARPYAARQA